ncbi:MAG: hypothetical protein QGG14_08765 [Planctomycetota bacterium]|nr:hypothetical protein [Planctomycetota bacterium]
MKSIRLIPLVVIFAGCPACSATTPNYQEEGLAALEAANYTEALRLLRLSIGQSQDAPELRRLVSDVYVLALIDQQREHVFAGANVRALEVLARVLERDPDNHIAMAWRMKARGARGAELTTEGETLLAADRLDEAQAKFQEALEFVPGDERARRGLRDLAATYRDKRRHAVAQMRLALLAREQLDWVRVAYHARVAFDADPTREDAKELEHLGQRKVADDHREWARQQQLASNWGGAGKSWRRAAQLAKKAGLEWVAEAEKNAEAMEREAKAHALFHRAETKISGRYFDKARKLIAEADPLCRVDRSYLNELQRFLLNRERAAALEAAHLSMLAYNLEKALKQYTALAKEGDDGTAAEKVKEIQAALQKCGQLYEEAAKAQAGGDLAKARSLWQEILATHPHYKDVPALFAATGKTDAK